MRVTWLLDPPADESDDLTGLLADAIASRGHTVRIVTLEQPPAMRGGRRAEWIEVDHWRAVDTSGDDAVIATSEKTAAMAGFWLCQTVVAEPGPVRVPIIVTGRAAQERWSQQGVEAFDAGLVVEDDVFRPRSPREHDPLRVLLAGASQTATNGIDDGYGAVAHARWFHQQVDLVRASPWAPSREEPLDSVQEYHVGLTGDESRRLLHSCDVVLVPRHAEGAFPLVAAEAMAAGIPCVMTATPDHRALAGADDYALFAPDRNAVELGERLIELLSDEELRDRFRSRGREVAEAWRPERAAARLEAILTSGKSS